VRPTPNFQVFNVATIAVAVIELSDWVNSLAAVYLYFSKLFLPSLITGVATHVFGVP
jgi:hypothetical protein